MKIPAGRGRFLRYIFVGMATAMVYFGAGVVCGWIFENQIRMVATLAFVVAVLFNYFAHFYFTFRLQGEHLPVIPRYLVMVLCGMVINWWLAGLLFPLVNSVWAVQLVCMMVVITWNMVLSAAWVFARKGGV